jgi:hypothetical protein
MRRCAVNGDYQTRFFFDKTKIFLWEGQDQTPSSILFDFVGKISNLGQKKIHKKSKSQFWARRRLTRHEERIIGSKLGRKKGKKNRNSLTNVWSIYAHEKY